MQRRNLRRNLCARQKALQRQIGGELSIKRLVELVRDVLVPVSGRRVRGFVCAGSARMQRRHPAGVQFGGSVGG